MIERTQEIWPLFALMQPANGAVFALFGMLAAALGVFVPVALLSLALDWGDRGRVGGARGTDRRAARDLRLALL